MIPRLKRLPLTWVPDFYQVLLANLDKLKASSHRSGRKFSVQQVRTFLPEAVPFLQQLEVPLELVRDFIVPASHFMAVGVHKDTPVGFGFAVNIFVRGCSRVHFYREEDSRLLVSNTTPEGNDCTYTATADPSETYDVVEGELTIMDISATHHADTSVCRMDEQIVLESFVPLNQFSYEEALQRLGIT